MSTMIPIIWVAEIEFLNERIQAINEGNDTSSAPKSPIPGVGSFHNKLEHQVIPSLLNKQWEVRWPGR